MERLSNIVNFPTIPQLNPSSLSTALLQLLVIHLRTQSLVVSQKVPEIPSPDGHSSKWMEEPRFQLNDSLCTDDDVVGTSPLYGSFSSWQGG